MIEIVLLSTLVQISHAFFQDATSLYTLFGSLGEVLVPQKYRICLLPFIFISFLPSLFSSRALAADATGELHVLGEDGDATCVERTEVGVLEEADEVRFCGLLERHQALGLEADVGCRATLDEFARDLAHEALERQLADEEVGRLLVLADLAERDGPRAVPVLLRLDELLAAGAERVLAALAHLGRGENKSGKRVE